MWFSPNRLKACHSIFLNGQAQLFLLEVTPDEDAYIAACESLPAHVPYPAPPASALMPAPANAAAVPIAGAPFIAGPAAAAPPTPAAPAVIRTGPATANGGAKYNVHSGAWVSRAASGGGGNAPPCRYYQQGHCKYGNRCFNSHN